MRNFTFCLFARTSKSFFVSEFRHKTMHAIQNQNQFLYSNINFKTLLGLINSALKPADSEILEIVDDLVNILIV